MSSTEIHPQNVIEVRNLKKWFGARGSLFGRLHGAPAPRLNAVDGVSFSLRPGQVLGLAGESGCGKSTTGMTTLQLYRQDAGEVLFRGRELLPRSSGRTIGDFRRRAQMIFQNPYESLNPRLSVAQSIMEPIAVHVRDPGERRRHLERAMERASLLPLRNYLDRYPHQLSGGQLQRIAIARAIALEPQFLVADEPVSMLDVSIRASVLNLLRRFADELSTAILYVSHDLSTMRHICSDVAIMYLGRIIEIGSVDDVLDTPKHPYARALMAAVPRMGGGSRPRPDILEGSSNPFDLPAGCRFSPRCPKAMDVCRQIEPALSPVGGGRQVACHLYP